MASRGSKQYAPIIERIFFDHYEPGLEEFDWVREEIEKLGTELSQSKRPRIAR